MADRVSILPAWRPLLASDLSRVQAIAETVHPDLPERLDVLAEKRALFPEGCLGFGGSEIQGYGLAHPWVLGGIPALDRFIGSLPQGSDCLYVHDVALLPGVRGLGGASRYVAAMAVLARSRGLGRLACVAVHGAERLWSSLGFEEVPDVSQAPKLRSYGEGARYLIRRL